MKPLIIINFKNYQEAVGNKAFILAKKISQVKKSNYEIVVAPTLLTIKEIAEKIRIVVYSQHASANKLGPYTGRISPVELKQIGVQGTILNHSERKIPFSKLKEIVILCKKQKIKTVICASTLSEIKKVSILKPNYIAYEPKELIGGKISVTESKPELIIKAVELVKKCCSKTKLLCGAGIHSKEDLGHALLLGTAGVLIGHAVPKSKDPKLFLEKMLL